MGSIVNLGLLKSIIEGFSVIGISAIPGEDSSMHSISTISFTVVSIGVDTAVSVIVGGNASSTSTEDEYDSDEDDDDEDVDDDVVVAAAADDEAPAAAGDDDDEAADADDGDDDEAAAELCPTLTCRTERTPISSSFSRITVLGLLLLTFNIVGA
jgi:hypothetical protein